MKIVGLTGGIGSGKSTVAAMFENLNVPIYNSDREAKKLMNSSDTIRTGLLTMFGENCYENGSLNRAFIADIVFNDSDALQKLNNLVHPEVRRNFKEWVQQQKASYVIQENPLIFESKSQKDFDFIITVSAPKSLRIQRVMKRDQSSEQQVQARIDNQMDDDLKTKRSNFVIINENLENTQMQVEKIHEQVLSQIP